jgi:hypothetical protein
MKDCHSSYERFATAKAQGEQSEIDQTYRQWRAAFGVLDTAVADVDEVLHIFGKKARDQVNMYLISESAPCAEDGYAVSAAIVELPNEPPENPQATTGGSRFLGGARHARPLHQRKLKAGGNSGGEEIGALSETVVGHCPDSASA